MNLYDSHIEAAQELSEKDKKEYYCALIEYVHYGKEPVLSGAPKAVFTAIKPTLDMIRARSKAGASKRKQSSIKDGTNVDQTEEQNAIKTESNDESNDDQIEIKSGTKNKNKNKYKDKEEITPNGVIEKKSRFVPPSVEDVQAYAAEKGYSLDAQRFCDFYQSKGWMVGKNKMKDWRAAVRGWQARNKEVSANAADHASYAAWLDYPSE